MEGSEPGRRRAKRQGFRGAVAILTAVVTVATVLLIGGGVLQLSHGLFSELPPRTRRVTSPDGRTDLVLTWRGGGGAAGWTEESVALEAHGPSTGDGDELATFDPEALVGARWLSSSVAEIRLVEAVQSGSLPATVHVGGRLVTLKVSATIPETGAAQPIGSAYDQGQ